MDNGKTGALIAARRQELGLTQKELANQLNLSDRTVSKWERGAGFPDVSLIEPLADALGLSVLELIHGQRDDPEERLSPEAERSVRKATQELGVRFVEALRRYRRALVALGVLLVCGVAVFLHLWFSPFQSYTSKIKEVPAAEALKVCPFAIITADDFELSRRLLADPEIGGLMTSFPSDGDSISDDEVFDISGDVLDPYRERASIDGKPAEGISVEVIGGRWLYLHYTREKYGCSLMISQDGRTIQKCVAIFPKSPQPGRTTELPIADMLVENENNLTFTVSRTKRDLLDFAK